MTRPNQPSLQFPKFMQWLLFFLMFGALCLHVRGDAIKAVTSGLTKTSDEISVRPPKFRSWIWCSCRRRFVRSIFQCRCSLPPRITPVPTMPPPEPLPDSWICKCNGTEVEARTREECRARPSSEHCKVDETRFEMDLAEFRCFCLSRWTRDREECCVCQRRKCKCWNGWWRDRNRWGWHRSFNHCNGVCRKRGC